MAEHENESTPLLSGSINDADEDDACRGLLSSTQERERHKRICRNLLVAFAVIAVANVLAVYFVYYHNCVALRVISLNVWGMPGGLGGCKDKAARIKAIAEKVSEANFDVMTLQELWMEPDHDTIAAAANASGYHITQFRQLASSLCDGRVLITTCSGLTIISIHEFRDIEFNMYTYRGSIWDGEAFAGKGVGRVRIEPRTDLTVDIFTTHTIADSGTTMANNTWYRVKQVEELMGTYVAKSNATAIILAGDFNTSPVERAGEPYQIVKEHMVNCLEELFHKLQEWLAPQYYTYGNDHNTYTRGAKGAATIDYVFHRANANRTAVWTNLFKMPYFKTRILKKLLEGAAESEEAAESEDGRKEDKSLSKVEKVSNSAEVEISLSDHESVESTIYLRRWSETWPYL